MSWALADFRLTNYRQIDGGGAGDECLFIASLHTNALHQSQPQPSQCDASPSNRARKLALLPFWNPARDGNRRLNNLRFGHSAFGNLEFA